MDFPLNGNGIYYNSYIGMLKETVNPSIQENPLIGSQVLRMQSFYAGQFLIPIQKFVLPLPHLMERQQLGPRKTNIAQQTRNP